VLQLRPARIAGLVALSLVVVGCGDDPAVREGPGEADQPGPWGDTGTTGAVDGGAADGGADGGGADGGALDGGATGDGGTSGDGGSSGGSSGDGGGGSSTAEICYPGADWDWTACLPLVDWQASWGSDYAYPDPYGGSDQYIAPARYVDLATADPALMVAPNFRLDELMQEWKGQWGVYQHHMVEHLQAIRDASGGPLTVNSGYRNPAYNASVGGATYSRHMYGDAADLVSSTLSLDALADVCEAEGADYIGMYTAHVHCDWRNDPLDGELYDLDKDLGEDLGVAAAALPELSARVVQGHDGHLFVDAEGFDEGEPALRWTAFDIDGRVVATSTAASVLPGDGVDRVDVQVGGPMGPTVAWSR